MNDQFYQDELMVMVPHSSSDGKSAYAYAVEGGYTGTETEFAQRMAFLMNGTVVGYVEGNTIFLSGNLANGTYTAYYEITDSEGNTSLVEIGDLTLGEEETEKPAEPVTESIALTKDMSISVSTGEDRDQAAYVATPTINLADIPRPCVIQLEGACWAYANASDTGYIRCYMTNASGNKLVGDYTHFSKMPSGVSMVYNSDDRKNVTVTIASDAIRSVRFSGCYGNTALGSGTGNYNDAKVTLTYTPAS